MEPMQQARKLEKYRRKIGFAQAVANVSNKIWAFIDEVFEVTIIYDMVKQLTLRLFHTETQVELILTLVYAKCDAIERMELWDSLYVMAKGMTIPWLDGGDFNDSIHTWWNGREEEYCIFKRLDKCLANMKVQQIFPGLEVKHDLFKDVVRENCHTDFSVNPYIIFNYKLKKLKKALTTWSKATYGDIFQKIVSLEEVFMVHEAQFEANPTQLNRERLQKVQAELIRYLALEEEFWKQKLGMAWFKDGDRNTKFFHAQVNGRRKRLQVKKIQNSLRNWIEEDEEMAEEVVKLFKEQFSETVLPTAFGIIDHVPSMVYMEQNTDLIRQPTKEEVKQVVFGLNRESARGSDGLTGSFYHS
ncbi:uncharacterized protein LOC142177090 [Nicotiana tabacum]|uniref:Uncharacterized protein LOC142177090 n=1 Tax=Nicotiana tabacum TaxID=4097 RepID=A0AC58TWQ7_TOBAC